VYEIKFKPTFTTLCLRKKILRFSLEDLGQNDQLNTDGILIKHTSKILVRLS
jgi:hypothetical protein